MAGRTAKPVEGVWALRRGKPRKISARPNAITYREDVDYNNPYRYKIEKVWWDGKVVYASEQGELDVDPRVVKVAQEYQIVHTVSLDRKGKLRREPDRVRGQLNIYDSIPGMKKYSPIWQFNYVVVPRDYVPNTLRSERDCLKSGYEIRRSRVFEN